MRLWSTRETRSELMLACLRILMGVIFLAVWAYNLVEGLYTPTGWADFVQEYADTTRIGPYADLLESVMIPNAAFFASSQFVIEFLVFGLFLTLGLFTPVSALLAALFQLNLLIATSGTGEWPGTYVIMLLLLVAIGITQSGRTLGLDALFARRDPHPRFPIY